MRPTLLVLAAGLGTRYGGLKQIEPIGPHGETIIDYSVYDGIRAGFGKVVFVVRRSFEDPFKETVSRKFETRLETTYAYQELDACLGGFEIPVGRRKPWGTGHAILVSKDAIREPFAVINADDYYGADALRTIVGFLTTPDLAPNDHAMVGYTLGNTLCEHGAVCRGVSKWDERLFLKRIMERKGIEKTAEGIRYPDDEGRFHTLTGNEIVSMNLWGFQTSLFAHLESQFAQFLREHGREKGSELFIPAVVDALVTSGRATVKILQTADSWFGVTYRADRSVAIRRIRRLIDDGVYPEKLWR